MIEYSNLKSLKADEQVILKSIIESGFEKVSRFVSDPKLNVRIKISNKGKSNRYLISLVLKSKEGIFETKGKDSIYADYDITKASHKVITHLYNEVVALKGISYQVNDGEIFGILGPNGAGKSTMIKILTCFHKPTSGEVIISGIPIDKKEDIKKLIGWVPQEDTFYPSLTIEENLEYFASLYDLKKKDYKKKISDLLDILQIANKKNSLAGSLSGGMKRRLSMAIALVHNPQVIYLDEPTAGVDPVSRRSIWDAIRKIKSMGLTVIFCTHYLDEAD